MVAFLSLFLFLLVQCVMQNCDRSFVVDLPNMHILGRLFERVDLIKPVSKVRPYVRLSTKSFFDFSEIWHVGRSR